MGEHPGEPHSGGLAGKLNATCSSISAGGVQHDLAPALALYLHGNDHVIEYNEVTRVMLEGDDMGAFYMGRDPTERGNIIRYNYWHHLAPAHMTWCLYFDDSGGDSTKIYGNIFLKAGNLFFPLLYILLSI